MLSIIEMLTSFPNRLGSNEAAVAAVLQNYLQKQNVAFSVQSFETSTPRYLSSSLLADGLPIDHLPCGLVSGKIDSNYNLISSLTSSQRFIDTPNINFNPQSDAICLSNFYHAPALAISRKDVDRVMRAQTIQGELQVERFGYQATNILIGNAEDPKYVIFAHYDAYFSGATDNASGVAVVLEAIKRRPELLQTSLFVLVGNEELSYDYPIYWGRCFRQFYGQNEAMMLAASEIYVIDSVGDGKPLLEVDQHLVGLAFPIGVLEVIAKSKVLTGNFAKLMNVYHSDIDTISRLNLKYLELTVQLLMDQISGP